jgi:sugar/nucleoside kinase (ribokinase family)
MEVQSETLLLGGEAANTANALTLWGAPVRLFGNEIGEGPEAETLRELLAEHRLALNAAGEPPRHQRTPVCDIYVTPDGDRTMYGLGFSDMEPVFDPTLLPLTSGDWFTAEPNMSAVSRQAVRAASAAGMQTYLMDFIREDDPVAPGSFWQSSTDWAGRRGDEAHNIAWVDEWTARHGCVTILSDGPLGLVAGSPDHPARAFPPFPSPVVVDTTGAGDGFRAGMLFGLDKEWPVGRCLAFAAAAGSLICRGMGATSDVPTVEEIEAFLREHSSLTSVYENGWA